MNEKPKQENWKQLPGFPRYLVSDLGQVKLVVPAGEHGEDRILKPYKASSHGMAVHVKRDDGSTWKPMIRLLVCRTWVPNPKKLRWIHHLNGDYTDCRACNLVWSDIPEPWFGRPGYPVTAIDSRTGRELGTYHNQSAGARAFGLPSGGHVSAAVHRKGCTAGGICWVPAHGCREKKHTKPVTDQIPAETSPTDNKE